MKRIIKCVAAFLLALVLCLCLLPTTAFAASKQVYIWNFPLSDDTLKSSGKWGHGALNLRFGYVPELVVENGKTPKAASSWTQHYLTGLGIGLGVLAAAGGVCFFARRRRRG